MMYSAKISHKNSTYTYDNEEISLIPDTRIEGQRNRGIEGQKGNRGTREEQRDRGKEDTRSFLYHCF